MTQKILILTALASELNAADAPDGVEVIYTGVGKINAAATATAAILQRQPQLIVNFGTAGKINPAVDGLLDIASVIQRDMLAIPLAARGVTPLSDEPNSYASGHGNAICGTGDSFVTASDPWLVEQGVDVVDMELFAIAHTCHRYGVPWRAFKFITDSADEDAADHWNDNVHRGAELFWRTLDRILAD
ncbi:nucleoside phosphorylase [Herbaspirillum sp. CF444]|uniref:phosphorylase family protein n=1 Tax=Herbaspirillum sp. CF444 TaxID=1144319 RepID=UPI0002723A93|nr:5'-methylthioadenosine nucleosidase [Herbaspirillum sp. CF444]EJL83476.1 nucleoside phosphorylase [Herbaspirillum sp. CF444]